MTSQPLSQSERSLARFIFFSRWLQARPIGCAMFASQEAAPAGVCINRLSYRVEDKTRGVHG